ncbi:UNVERIFIED_CONTAM: Non-specific lipid-transfer protein 2 [Sesamum radiatum]|uniref:Non-specific lipid-transfer protein 2 n=1 Tax=Sesamum radiatum TaxID=300843 RepID=A0AAW2UBQ9_SESRA
MAGVIKSMCIVLIAAVLAVAVAPRAQTTPDRQSVCSCLKSLAGSYKDVDLNKAAGLPGQCGVNIPYKISPSTDCSKVN